MERKKAITKKMIAVFWKLICLVPIHIPKKRGGKYICLGSSPLVPQIQIY